MCEIRPETDLKDLNLPYLETVLNEAFSILPLQYRRPIDPSYPITVADLAQQAHLPARSVAGRLEEIKLLAADIEITATTAADTVLSLDPQAAQFVECLPGCWLELVPGELNEQFVRWQRAERLVVVAEEPRQAFSAAMYLREKGLVHTHFLSVSHSTGP